MLESSAKQKWREILFSVDLLNCISSGWFLIIQQDTEYASLSHLTSSFSFLWVFIGLQHFQPAFYSASCSFVVYWYYWLFILLAVFTRYIFCLHWKEMFQWMISPWTLILVGVLYLVWVKQCFHFLVSYLSYADRVLFCQRNSLFLAEVWESCN